MNNDYIVKNVYRSFVVVSILSAMTATIGVLIDNIIVGHFLGEVALGAMGVVNPVTLIFSAFGNVCSGGGTARSAQAIGRGDTEQVRRIFTVTMILAAASGILLTIIGLLFTPEIASVLGAHGELEQPTIDFLSGYFLGATPTILMTALMGFVRVDGSKNLPLICIGVMTAVNITLDLVMVLVFHQGMFGMALATSISYCCAVLVGCLHFKKEINSLKLVKPKQAGRELWEIITTGLPTSISRICDTIKVLVLNNLLVVTAGAAAVTALSVRTQANSFLGALMVGLGTAAIPVVGMFFGEEDKIALKATLKTSLRYGLTLNGIMAVVLLLFPGFFAKLLGVADAETLVMANQAIRFFAVGMPVALVNTVLMNFYQSTRRTGFATCICIMQGLLYTVLFAFALINPLGSTGVWAAFLLGEICTLISIIVFIICKNRRFSIKLIDCMMLGENFGGDPKDRLELSIGNSMEEVMKISQGIHKFGSGRDIDEKTLNRLTLFIEEMAGNVVQHAFKPKEKKWFDLMILNKQDSIVIRMRDNGAMFDPLSYINSEASAQQKEQQAQGYGLQIVSSLADQFVYRRSMGLNVVIMEISKIKTDS